MVDLQVTYIWQQILLQVTFIWSPVGHQLITNWPLELLLGCGLWHAACHIFSGHSPSGPSHDNDYGWPVKPNRRHHRVQLQSTCTRTWWPPDYSRLQCIAASSRAVPSSDWLEGLPPWWCVCAFVCMPVCVCGHSNEAYSASIIRAASLLAPAWWMRPFLIFRYWDVISHSSVRWLGWFMIHSFTSVTQFIS